MADDELKSEGRATQGRDAALKAKRATRVLSIK